MTEEKAYMPFDAIRLLPQANGTMRVEFCMAGEVLFWEDGPMPALGDVLTLSGMTGHIAVAICNH